MTHPASSPLIPPEPDEGHPSEYALLLHLAAETEVVSGHLSTCAACRARVTALQAERTAFPAEPRFERTLELLASSRRAAALRPGGRTARFLLAFAATAAAVLITLGVLWLREDHGGQDTLRVKGSDILWVVDRGGIQRPIEAGFRFEAGDQLVILVDVARPVFAVLFSVNAVGEVRPLLPAAGGRAPIEANSRTPLPLSLRVEAPIEPIRVFVVLTEAETPSEDLLKVAAGELRRLRAAGQDLRELTGLPVAGRVDSRLIE